VSSGLLSSVLSILLPLEMCSGLVVLAPLATRVKHKPPNRHKNSHRTPENDQSANWHKHTAQTPKICYLIRVKGIQPTMRKIEAQMNAAVQSNANWSSGNTTVHFNAETGESLIRLHGNLIAIVDEDSMKIFDGGWQSTTTKSRLNALCDAFCVAGEGIFQKDFKWFVRKFAGQMGTEKVYVNEAFSNGYVFA